MRPGAHSKKQKFPIPDSRLKTLRISTTENSSQSVDPNCDIVRNCTPLILLLAGEKRSKLGFFKRLHRDTLIAFLYLSLSTKNSDRHLYSFHMVRPHHAWQVQIGPARLALLSAFLKRVGPTHYIISEIRKIRVNLLIS